MNCRHKLVAKLREGERERERRGGGRNYNNLDPQFPQKKKINK